MPNTTNKKRTFEALTQLIRETKDEISYLESIQTSLDIAMTEDDLAAIKEELSETGYVRRKTVRKKIKLKNEPLHYISSDGFHMYVGKNNLQNDALTFDFAAGCDWWFHAKQAPGSHVIVKTNGEELPDRTFEEAGKLAAYYSSMRGSEKVEIDYIEKKHIKKTKRRKTRFCCLLYKLLSRHRQRYKRHPKNIRQLELAKESLFSLPGFSLLKHHKASNMPKNTDTCLTPFIVLNSVP